jgi:hypothetical protein
MYDAVVVVDGGVPDGPPNPAVVAFLGSGRTSERQQEFGAVLFDGKCLIQTLERVVGVRNLFKVADEEAYGSLFFRWSGGGKPYRAGTAPALYAGRIWRYFTDGPS